jgi:flagellar assembly protein FliH
MSDKMKINLRPGRFNLKLKDNKLPQPLDSLSDKEVLQQKLEENYEAGFDDGYSKAKSDLQKEFNSKLDQKYDELNKIISLFNDNIKAYDKDFEKVIVRLALVISEKIIRKEIEEESGIIDVLKESLRKIVGANSVVVRLNPVDYKNVVTDNKKVIADEAFSKINFESDDRIEKGGCLIESDIGNVDARISTQLNEIKKQFEANFSNDI